MTDFPPRKMSDALRAEALDWVVRLREGGAADWEAFEAWMVADPGAADIYWQLAAADADVAEALSQPLPTARARPVQMRVPKHKWLAGGVLALAASVLLLLWVKPLASTHSIETMPGQTRRVTLEDGSDIILNGDSRIELGRGAPRSVRLAAGEARFTVTHDVAKPFRVHVGDAVLVDLGTIFSVARQDGEINVAVAEGAVRYSGGGVVRDLKAGDTLRIGRDGKFVTGRVDPADVGIWAEGRLAYNDTRVATVAADLSRATGLAISVDRNVADRPFSGGFALGRRDAETVRRAARLMRVAARADGKGWILEAPASGLK